MGPFPHTDIGRCIYCDSSDGPLTREHVIPRGLGGKLPLAGTSHALVLRNASCGVCQKVIQPLEEHYLKQTLNTGRSTLGLKEKSRSESPRGLVRRNDGSERLEEIDFEHVPAVLAVPSLRSARLMRERLGIDDPDTFDLWVYQVRGWSAHPDVNVTSVSGLAPLNMPTFCRVMAKMAHGLLVGFVGPDGFRPFLRDFILAGTGDHFNYVGGHAPQHGTPDQGHLHRWRLGVQDGLWIVEIQLFAQFGGPVNYVVAGEEI